MARLWEQEARQFLLADRQALASLLSFVGGALIARLGERIGPTSRGWLWLGTMCQALFTMAAAISSWKSGQGYPGISDDRFVLPLECHSMTHLWDVPAMLGAPLGATPYLSCVSCSCLAVWACKV